MKPYNRALAIRAYNLASKNIIGDELAARLRTDPDTARALAYVGGAILAVEAQELTRRELQALKVIVRMEVRRLTTNSRAWTLAEIDRAAGKRSGWCAGIVGKRLMRVLGDRRHLGFVSIDDGRHVAVTSVGWSFAWEAGLIKPNWRVPA